MTHCSGPTGVVTSSRPSRTSKGSNSFTEQCSVPRKFHPFTRLLVGRGDVTVILLVVFNRGRSRRKPITLDRRRDANK